MHNIRCRDSQRITGIEPQFVFIDANLTAGILVGVQRFSLFLITHCIYSVAGRYVLSFDPLGCRNDRRVII